MKVEVMKPLIAVLKISHLLLFALSVFAACGCTVQYVAEYDENIKNEILRISREVEMFYTELSETDMSDRKYESFKDKYILIEVDIRTLLTKNLIRPLNEESTKQTEIALKLWLEDKENHKTNNSVSDFIIDSHRKQFQRIFIAMAIGEDVKEE